MHFDTVIIGGGPAGTGVLLKAMKDGTLELLLDRGIAIVEKSGDLMQGSLVKYLIDSDTLSNTFLECLEGQTSKYIDVQSLADEIRSIKLHQDQAIPLNELSQFFKKLGELLTELINAHQKCRVYKYVEVEKIETLIDGKYALKHKNDNIYTIIAKNIILATGGSNIGMEEINSKYLKTVSLGNFKEKCFKSADLLQGRLDVDLVKSNERKLNIVILGSSHSAFSCANYLLDKLHKSINIDNPIKLFANSKPKIFFPSTEDAHASNYHDFNDDDICPITKRVYRLAGLRMKSRDLFMAMESFNVFEENRVVLIENTKNDKIDDILVKADLIILALGYRFNIIPIFDVDAKEISLKGNTDARWVDDHCCLLADNKKPLSNIYALGLASGFIPSGLLGGEPSFKGQTNGIWYYQNAIAEQILHQVLI